jgi:hypothetical protein
MYNDRVMRAIDRWWTTDPDIENCVECGEVDGHDAECPGADWEPDYEQIHRDRTERYR